MIRTTNITPWLLLLSFVGLSCAGMEAPTAADQSADYDEGWAEYELAEEAPADDAYYRAGSAPAAPPPSPEPMEAKRSSGRDKAKEAPGKAELDGRMSDMSRGEQADEAPTRAWFPESFLFEPLVVTDQDGLASVEVTVPDQLTDWRILALAHDRDGGQAGTEARFASTMPVYLDVVQPPTLRVGDVVDVPMQVVNNQDDEGFAGGLSARMTGEAALGATSGTMKIDARDSVLQYVTVRALRPGEATLKVDLVGTDRVERPVTVVPTGRRLDRSQGGTLAAAREFSITSPYGAQPGSSSLALVVYPGPLGILAEEMGRSLPGAHLHDASYGFALAGYGRDIAERLGQEIDGDALRRSRILAYQRLVRFTRSPSLPDAVVALAAARTQPDDELAVALSSRLADQIVNGQSPDGSFAAAWNGSSASLPRALVLSAVAAHTTRDHSARVAQRAQGFVARNVGYVNEPYTASVLLASGLVEGVQAERLLELVLEGVTVQPDGTKVLKPGEGAQRLDGRTPGVTEATAWALLALSQQDGQQELVSDLAAALLGDYRPGRGFGDGLAGMAALEALTVVFAEPLPETVQVRLSVDGEEILSRDMNLAGNYAPLVAQAPAPGLAGPHSYRLEATPAVPGLAFTLTQTAYLPWEGDPGAEGFSLKVSPTAGSAVGETLPCRLQAAVPGGEAFTIVLELPAGVEVEQRSLQALVSQGGIQAFDASEGRLELVAPALSSGAVFDATVELVPTLAGSFEWGGASLALAADPDRRVQAPVSALRVARR